MLLTGFESVPFGMPRLGQVAPLPVAAMSLAQRLPAKTERHLVVLSLEHSLLARSLSWKKSRTILKPSGSACCHFAWW